VAGLIIALLIGGAIAVGSGLTRLPSFFPLEPVQSPSPTAEATASPVTSPLKLGRRAPSWTTGGEMPGVRGPGPFATVLRDGTVLIVGLGFANGNVPVEGAALYDPRKGVGSATLLADGTVLVAGAGPLGTGAERYDPSTGQWTDTGSMSVGRPAYSQTKERWASDPAGYSATLLMDGRVLVAGGAESPFGTIPKVVVANAELYDPSTGRWTATGSMLNARANHTATLLPDGKVLVAGGASYAPGGPSGLDSAEMYDPATGIWSATGSLRQARASHTATLLENGTVLVAGNAIEISARASTELFDPIAGLWSGSGDMTAPRSGQTATLLLDGNVLVVGGRTPDQNGPKPAATAEIYDAATGLWTATVAMADRRAQHAAVLLLDGRALVVGGEKDFLTMNWLSSSELYDPGDVPSRQ